VVEMTSRLCTIGADVLWGGVLKWGIMSVLSGHLRAVAFWSQAGVHHSLPGFSQRYYFKF